MFSLPNDKELEKWGHSTMARNMIDENTSVGKFLKFKYQSIAKNFFETNKINGSEGLKAFNTIGIASAPSIGIHYYILHRHHGLVPSEILNNNKRAYFFGTFGFGTAWAIQVLLKSRNKEKNVQDYGNTVPSMYKSFDLITPDAINFDNLGMISCLVMGYSLYSNNFRQSIMIDSLRVSKSKNYLFAVLLSLTLYQFTQAFAVKLDIESIRSGSRQNMVERQKEYLSDETSVQQKFSKNRENYADVKRIEQEGYGEDDYEKIMQRNDSKHKASAVSQIKVENMNENQLLEYLDKKR